MDNIADNDLILVTDDGTEVPCNKQILIKDNKYFAGLFDGHFKERLNNRVEIKEMSSNTLNTIVKYIYMKEYIFNSDELPDLLNGIELIGLTDFKEIVDQAIPDKINLLDNINLLPVFELFNLTHTLKRFKKLILLAMMNFASGYTYRVPENLRHLNKLKIDDFDISSNMKASISSSLFGCRFQHSCEIRHISLYATFKPSRYRNDDVYNGYVIYNINLCTGEYTMSRFDDECIILDTFSLNNINYSLGLMDDVLLLKSGNDEIKLNNLFEISFPGKFIKSNDNLYVVSDGQLVICSLLEERNYDVMMHYRNASITINSCCDITVINDEIYIVKNKREIISIYKFNKSDCTNQELCEYKIPNQSEFDPQRIEHEKFRINNICTLNDKIYISLLHKVQICVVNIEGKDYYIINDCGCIIRESFKKLLNITKCIECGNGTSDNCECTINNAWTYYAQSYSCKKCNRDDEYRDKGSDCYDNYMETIILEYDPSTNIVTPISQLQETRIHIAAFENKLYAAYIREGDTTLAVFNDNNWTLLYTAMRGVYEYMTLTGFTLMGNYL